MSPLRFCRNEDVRMKKLLSLWLLLCTTVSASPYQIAIHDEAFSRDSRTLASRIYYPTDAEGPRQSVGANPVFTGIAGQVDAPPAKGTFPLVVFSHGSGGNHASQAWLAAALVRHGVVVIAANSPGSTTGDSIPAQSVNLWRQTEDISTLIDAIRASPRWAALVNPDAIGVVGHSKGGYSAIAAIGGRVRLADFIAGCRQRPQSPNCRFYTQARVDLTQVAADRFDADYTDPRIRFAVALDPGMVPYLQPESLRHLNAPLLIIEPQNYLPDEKGTRLGGASLAANGGEQPIHAQRLTHGNHFDFLPICQPNGRHILASEEKDAEVLCATTPAQREWVHQQTVAAILPFIRPWLPAHAENR